MIGHLAAILATLAITVSAQDYQDYAQDYQLDNDRRRIDFDEDIPASYDYGNGLDPNSVPDLPPPRAPRPPPRRPPPPPRPSKIYGMVGKDSCGPRVKTAAHESMCDMYYDCYEDQGFLRNCPNGLVYKDGSPGHIGVCHYPINTDCGNRQDRNPPQSTEHCDWLYGIFGHETSCTRYWTCWNGTATEQYCIGGLLYNEETHACDWPQNVSGCQKHPLCKDDANGNVPLGKSCNRYWACQGGYPRLQRCPAMLVFDKNRKRCVTPPTEDCEVPTTNAPPPDNDYDDNGSGSRQSSNPRRGGGGSGSRNGGGGGSGSRRRDQSQDQGRPIPLDLPGGDNGPPNFKLPPGVIPLN